MEDKGIIRFIIVPPLLEYVNIIICLFLVSLDDFFSGRRVSVLLYTTVEVRQMCGRVFTPGKGQRSDTERDRLYFRFAKYCPRNSRSMTEI